MRFLKADKIFDGEKLIDNGSVTVIDDNNNFIELLPSAELTNQPIEKLNGILCPGFVNVHCHLELSHLFGKIPKHTGLPEFAKKIIQIRSHFSKDFELEKMIQADDWMYKNGIVAIGDICNNDSSFSIKQKSKIFYHSFIELIGLNPQNAQTILDKGISLLGNLHQTGLSGSIVPHAPYSSSIELIHLIANFNAKKKYPSTIHNQESEEENNFLLGKKNGFENLYAFLNIDISWFKAPKQHSLIHYEHELKMVNWILVHNTFTNANDIEKSAAKNIFWCFCPNANLYIENQLPKFELFQKQLDQLCIGTDSLASNETLDIIAEINLIKKHAALSNETILKAITRNGARALGLEKKFGSLIANKNTGLNLISFENNEFKFIKKIT